MRESDLERNIHYSEQTGHALRGEHDRVKDKIGQMPEGIPGFERIEVSRAWLIRRTMRRPTRTGKR